MNKAYRLIWSRAKDAWVIAAEIVKGNGGPPPITVSALVVAASLALAAGGAQALPVAPSVVNGTASFSTSGNALTVTNSPNAIINWQAFSIAANESARFNQQSALSAVLNRVTGLDPSQILGSLQSNGKVFLINPNGIIFGQGSRIDVGGLVASSLGISNQDFLAGTYRFAAGSTAGSVQNQGSITTTAGGMVWLISPNVENSGIITTPNGSVLLAAGQSVHMIDPQRPEIAVVVSAPNDQAVNIGTVLAQGGSVGIFGSLVSQQGVINADSAVAGENGRIFLKSTMSTTLGAGSVTSANALDTGDGGRIVVLSDGVTKVAGALSATGGPNGGNGGFIETSGSHVKIANTARVRTLAPSGKIGTWLIDPPDFTIASSGGDIDGVTLSTNLETSSITINSASGTVNTNGNGDIFVNDSVTWSSSNQLTLQADNNIAIDAAISGVNGTLTLDALGAATQSAPITAANLELLNGNFTLLNTGNSIGTLAGSVTAVDLFNNQTLTVGSAGGSTGLYASGDIRLEAKGLPGQNGIVVNSNVYGANVSMKGTGGAGADCTGAGCTGGYGGTGVEVNSSITAAGDITITGFGGNGGNATVGGTTGGNAYGGSGGNGINVSGGSLITSYGSSNTIRLEGTGGKGGNAQGGAYDQGTAGRAYGGDGGHGIFLKGQVGDRYAYSNVVLIGTGGSGGDATGGFATGNATYNGTGGNAAGGRGGHGIYLYGQPSYGQPASGYGMVSSGYGSINLQGFGGKGGFGTGGGGDANSRGGTGQGGNGGRGLFMYYSAQVASPYTGTISLNGTGGDGGIGTGGSGVLGTGYGSGGSGRQGIYVYGSNVQSGSGRIDLVGRGGKGGGGSGYGGDGGAGIHLYDSSVTSNNSYGGPISFTGTGGAGGIGGSSGGSGGAGIHLYSTTGYTMVRTAGGITLNGYAGSGGSSSGGTGGNGGQGLFVEYWGSSPWNPAIWSYSSPVDIIGNGGSGGIGAGGNGLQGMGVQDAWAGGEGAVRAPSATVTAQGGINLTGTLDSVTLNNSGSGDILFSTASYGMNNGLAVSGANTVAGGGFSATDSSGRGLTVAGITTANGLVNLQGDADVTFTGAINAGTGDVTVSAGYGGGIGAINGLAGVSSINARKAVLNATNGIGTKTPFMTVVSILAAYNIYPFLPSPIPADINISNTGPLTVTGIDNNAGSITLDNVGAISLDGTGLSAGYSAAAPVTPSCNITVTAHSPLTVNAPVIATGNISLNAGASGSALDTLLISPTGSVSGGNNVTLTAGNLVTMNGPVQYAQIVPSGVLTITQGLNPPPPQPPPSLPPRRTTLDVAVFINDVVLTMGRESTDLTDEDGDINEGGDHGGEAGNVSYCN